MKTLNIKTLLVILFMGAISVNSFAQGKEKSPRYVLNGFWDNWYMSVGAGAQSYYGTTDLADEPSIQDQATITYNVALGKWITPSVGIRFQGNYTPAALNYGPIYNPMEIMNAHADMTFNMSNIIGGYKDSRFFSIILYAGAGWGQTKYDGLNKEVETNTVSANAGWINKFRLGKKMDLNIELGVVDFPKSFDGVVSEDGFADLQLHATAGFTYRFGNKLFEPQAVVVPFDMTDHNRRIAELENTVKSEKAANAELNRKIEELLNRKIDTKVVHTGVELAGMSTFFNIGSSKLAARDEVNLHELAGLIKQTPDTKYKVSGLIDYSVGSKKRNDVLCAERTNAVYNELVKCGVSESQLVKSTEAPTSPSKNPILNRGVVVSAIK